MLYELSGKVKKVCEVQTFASGFKKRSLVVVEGENTKYPNVVSVDFAKEKADMLGSIREGQEVSVRFAVRGREWTDPKTNAVRYFTSLDGISVKVSGGESKAPAPAAAPMTIDDALDAPDMPF